MNDLTAISCHISIFNQHVGSLISSDSVMGYFLLTSKIVPKINSSLIKIVPKINSSLIV